jgi:glycosyltransferase involved in cell wall biosynthesis
LVNKLNSNLFFTHPTTPKFQTSLMKQIKLSIVTVTRNRPQKLIASAAVSLQQQTNHDFEWIVINDGGDRETKDSIEQLQSDFAIVIADMEHPETGFGLCYGRNLGLKLASSELVTYLDDDNHFLPEAVASIIEFFESHPHIKFTMPLQQRRRDAIEYGKTIKKGKAFVSPDFTTTVRDLIEQKQLIDSNGFTHHRDPSPSWNPNHRIYCDYEYFLQCLNVWNESTFALLPRILVDYVQTNDGVIGKSSYFDWAIELERIIAHAYSYSILQQNPTYIKTLRQLQHKFSAKQQSNSVPEAFKLN